MIEAQHVDAAVLERAADGVADDGGAQVADVHLLGHVGRGEVDHRAAVGQLRRPGIYALRHTWCWTACFEDVITLASTFQNIICLPRVSKTTLVRQSTSSSTRSLAARSTPFGGADSYLKPEALPDNKAPSNFYISNPMFLTPNTLNDAPGAAWSAPAVPSTLR